MTTPIQAPRRMPEDIMRAILAIKEASFREEQIQAARMFLAYYASDDILDGPNAQLMRQEAIRLLEKVRRYDTCIDVLLLDPAFRATYESHSNNQKSFRLMSWNESFITSIWMYKFH